jgi:MFS family permease
LTIPQTIKAPKKLWSIDFMLVLLTGHFMFVSYYALFTLVPPFAVDRGGEEWEIGIVIGSIGIMALLVRPFGGRWINSFGAKRIAISGAGLFAVTNLLYLLASNIWILVPIRMLQGMGVAIGPVATSTMVANLAPESRRGEAMGFMGIAIALSGLYSPVLAFWLLSELGFYTGFVYAAIGGLLGCVTAAKISSSNTNFTSKFDDKEPLPLIPRNAIFPTVIFIGYTITTAPVNTFLPLLSSDRDLGNPGLYFTTFSITTILLMSLSGPIADRFGRASVVIPGMVASSISMFLLAGAHSQATFLGSGFLNGIGFGLIQPGIQALIVDRVRPKERGPAMATVQQGWDIGGSSAFFLGPIGGIMGIASTFTISGMITLLATAGFIFGNSRNQPSSLNKK